MVYPLKRLKHIHNYYYDDDDIVVSKNHDQIGSSTYVSAFQVNKQSIYMLASNGSRKYNFIASVITLYLVVNMSDVW